MLNTLIWSFFRILRKPSLFLPALVYAVISGFFVLLTMPIILGFIYDITVGTEIALGNLADLPVLLLFSYPFEVFVIAGLFFVGLLLQIWLFFVYAKLVKNEKAGIKEGFEFGMKNLKEIFWIGFFLFVINFVIWSFVVLLSSLALLAKGISGQVMLLLLEIVMLLGVYVFFKLFFLPIAMAAEGLTIKKALEKVWGFSRKNFIEVVIIVVVLSILSGVIIDIGFELSEYIPEVTLSFLVFAVFALLAVAYSHLALVRFYVSGK